MAGSVVVGCVSEDTLGVGRSCYTSKGLLIFLPWSVDLVEIGEIFFSCFLSSLLLRYLSSVCVYECVCVFACSYAESHVLPVSV